MCACVYTKLAGFVKKELGICEECLNGWEFAHRSESLGLDKKRVEAGKRTEFETEFKTRLAYYEQSLEGYIWDDSNPEFDDWRDEEALSIAALLVLCWLYDRKGDEKARLWDNLAEEYGTWAHDYSDFIERICETGIAIAYGRLSEPKPNPGYVNPP